MADSFVFGLEEPISFNHPPRWIKRKRKKRKNEGRSIVPRDIFLVHWMPPASYLLLWRPTTPIRRQWQEISRRALLAARHGSDMQITRKSTLVTRYVKKAGFGGRSFGGINRRGRGCGRGVYTCSHKSDRNTVFRDRCLLNPSDRILAFSISLYGSRQNFELNLRRLGVIYVYWE